MNENIDLTKILEDCPKGTKFYTPMFGEVKFEKIHYDNREGEYTIVVYAFNIHLFANFSKDGFYYQGIGECTLLPSKDQRDWSKFTAPWYKKEKIGPRFKIGDWVVDNCCYVWKIEGILNQFYLLEGIEGGESRPIIDWVDKTFHLWTIKDAKDGDVLACNEEILLFKSYLEPQGRISLYCWYNGHTNNFHSKEVVDILLTTRNKVCPATKEQRDSLMKAMNNAGYEWDSEKKELKKEKVK